MKRILLAITFLLMPSLTVFGQTNGDCPKYEIVGPAGVILPGDYGVFEIKSDENFKKLNLSYVWTISNGEIYAGQGTGVVVVTSASKQDADVKATVSINGLPAGCVSTLSETAILLGVPKPMLVDESGAARLPDNVKARLDQYFSMLQNNPSAEGFIVFKSKTKSAVNEQLKKVSSYIYFRNQDASRIIYRIITVENDENTAYWIVPSGAPFDSEEEAINIRASEYENVRKFFAANPRRK